MKFSVHPSLILWLSILWYLQPWTVGPFLLAVAVHESGHYLALCSMDKPPLAIRLSFTGAQMETPPLGYGQEFSAAAAGPLTSLALGLLLPLWPELGGYSILLGLFNLLPIRGLDGGRMLKSALLLRLPGELAEKISSAVGLLTALLLLGFGGCLSVFAQMGLWPMVLAGDLLVKALLAG